MYIVTASVAEGKLSVEDFQLIKQKEWNITLQSPVKGCVPATIVNGY